MTSFHGLHVALSSLQTQRHALEITGHNVANVNTEGYSRQRVDMAARTDAGQLSAFSRPTNTGNGVTTQELVRIRDAFLGERALTEHATDAGLRRTKDVLARVELAFNEPSDTGLGSQLADFWAGWDDVANNPGDLAARSQLLERAATVTMGFNGAISQLETLRGAITEQTGALVVDINSTAQRVAGLNKAIVDARSGGSSANDLADQRDLLVLKLGQQLGITTRPQDDGSVTVMLGGAALVRGDRAEPLGTATVGGVTQVRWPRSGQVAPVTSGELAANLQAVDVTLPGMVASLQAVGDRLLDRVNTLHRDGIGLPPAEATGLDLFERAPDGSLQVNPTLAADPAALGARAPGEGELDGTMALRLAERGDGPDSPDAAYRRLVVDVGVAAQTVNRRVSMQSIITKQVDEARSADSGVNLDEEMVSMIAYQHAYSAAARFLTTVDELLQTLVTSTGLVGR